MSPSPTGHGFWMRGNRGGEAPHRYSNADRARGGPFSRKGRRCGAASPFPIRQEERARPGRKGRDSTDGRAATGIGVAKRK